MKILSILKVSVLQANQQEWHERSLVPSSMEFFFTEIFLLSPSLAEIANFV